jgi:RNA polymerase sigma-70 factor (ECF subfamily)
MEPDQQNSPPADELYQAKKSLFQAVFLTDLKKAATCPLGDEKSEGLSSLQAATRESDNRLVLAAKQNQKEFTKLYSKYWQDVFCYFWRRLGKESGVAEDLSQETFFRALRYLPAFQPGNASYRTYLLRIAHNLLVNFYREKKLASLEEASQASDKKDGKFKDVVASDNLWQSVRGLPNSEQQVLIMMYQEGMSVHEISLLLNKTENAVKLLLSRGRAKLRGQDCLK